MSSSLNNGGSGGLVAGLCRPADWPLRVCHRSACLWAPRKPMSLLLVPYAHLAHLIKKAEMPDVERESLLALAAIVDVDPRVQVVKKLEKHYPGLGRRLDALWSVEGIGSVHLFKVP